jgi:hypothetical protein
VDITVTMDEVEIIQAIKDYMSQQDVVTINKDVEVNLVAGRGVNGHSAVISIKSGVIAPPENRLEAAGQIISGKKEEVPAEKAAPPVAAKKPAGKSVTEATQTQTANLFADEPVAEPVAETPGNAFDENTLSEGTVAEDSVPSPEVESLFG